RDGGVEIEALEQAVARDVGIDDGGDARVLEAARNLERRQFRRLGPALYRHLAVARIESDRDAAGKLPGRFLDQRRVAHLRRADDDAVDAFLQPAGDSRQIADAAAELH